MREEDAERTVECLRGRLVAERAASRSAKEAAHLMGNKLMELEAMLKEETELRNRAEKRSKHLVKKLESINMLSFTMDESENWNLTEGSEDSSASLYTASSTSKDSEYSMLETQQAMCSSSSSVGYSQETMGNGKANDESLSSSCEEQTAHLESIDGNSMKKPLEEQGADNEEKADNSMALLAPICSPNPSQTIDPAVVLHANDLRDVLDSLRQARERLQNQMERRHLIRVTHLPKRVLSHGFSLHCGIIRG